jgi:pyruvate carboxylase
VEHTVTEMVTGIDLVRAQIQIAQGCKLHESPMSLPLQPDIPLYGYALQCRVTTEDPENNFTPDYGRIQTYRSPAGFGVRLDGSAYSGAAITPFYDSLLVKISTWGREFDQACNRMDRSLREFRVRGVKTNIPFLENVVNDSDFRSGNITTSFIDRTPSLFNFSPRKDRATKILTFLGETAVLFRTARICQMDDAPGTPSDYRHDFPRRSPVPLCNPHADGGSGSHCQLRFQQAFQSVQSGNVGRRDLRCLHALPP